MWSGWKSWREQCSTPYRPFSEIEARFSGNDIVNQMRKAAAVNSMSTKAGVWIDHRTAYVVGLTPDGEVSSTILSNVEKQPERGSDSPLKASHEARRVPADSRRQRALTGKLNKYYDAVIVKLRDYDSWLILGPGEAKGELHARILHGHLGAHVAAVRTEDKMSDRELVAKVEEYFEAATKAQRLPAA
jgi:hypothetical protein